MLMKNYLKVQFIHLSLKAFMMGIVLVGTSLQAMDKQENEKTGLPPEERFTPVNEEMLRMLKDKKETIVWDIGPAFGERSLMKGNEKDSHFLTDQQQHQFLNHIQSMLAPGGTLTYTAWDEKGNPDGTVTWKKGNDQW